MPQILGNPPGGKAYHHTQSSPSATWTIEHNLGYTPAGLLVMDSAGTEVVGEILTATITTLTVSFSGAFSGQAWVS